MYFSFLNTSDFEDRGEWDCVQPFAFPKQERLDDCKRKRQLQSECSPCARFGLDADSALEPLHAGFHDVHSDASTRYFGDDVGVAQTGAEDKVELLAV